MTFKEVNRYAKILMGVVLILGVLIVVFTKSNASSQKSPEMVKKEMQADEPVKLKQRYLNCTGMTDKIAQFIFNCADKANSPSNENNSVRLIQECNRVAVDLYCKIDYRFITKVNNECFDDKSSQIECNLGQDPFYLTVVR